MLRVRRISSAAASVQERPPSTDRMWPLIHPACSLAKNSTALAMSWAVEIKPRYCDVIVERILRRLEGATRDRWPVL
jgi:hypothetical protein